MDVTGSMCLGYSTLGKKDDGKLLKENSPHNKLMLIWAIHHGRKQTPALIHENVRGFSSSYLSAKLGHFGYRFLTSIQTTGENCAMKANSRQRLNLSQLKQTLPFSKIPYTYKLTDFIYVFNIEYIFTSSSQSRRVIAFQIEDI